MAAIDINNLIDNLLTSRSQSNLTTLIGTIATNPDIIKNASIQH